MLVQGDDVLVGRLGLVLLGGAQVGEVEVELGGVAPTENVEQRRVPRAARQFGLLEAEPLPRTPSWSCGARPSAFTSAGGFHVVLLDAPQRRPRGVLSHVRDPLPSDELLHLLHALDLDHVERRREVIGLRLARRLPEVERLQPGQARHHSSGEATIAAGRPRRVAVARAGRGTRRKRHGTWSSNSGTLADLSRVDGHRVEPGGAEHVLVARLEIGDVVAIEMSELAEVEGHFVRREL